MGHDPMWLLTLAWKGPPLCLLPLGQLVIKQGAGSEEEIINIGEQGGCQNRCVWEGKGCWQNSLGFSRPALT